MGRKVENHRKRFFDPMQANKQASKQANAFIFFHNTLPTVEGMKEKRLFKKSKMSCEESLCGILNISTAERVKAHYDGAKTHLLNSNEILRRTSHEQDLYSKYCASGEVHGPTIYSSKGFFLFLVNSNKYK